MFIEQKNVNQLKKVYTSPNNNNNITVLDNVLLKYLIVNKIHSYTNQHI